jgi:predicted nucleic acid-binding protein
LSLVLDSSMCLAWCFADERTPAVLGIVDRVIEAGAVVPRLWRYEIGNGLLMAQRRQRLDAARRTDLLLALRDFRITEDQEPEGDPWQATIKLADLYRLTVYDAAYLELAQRRRLPVATLDAALQRAARAAGVDVLG